VQRIALIGSTGSIGLQTLEVVGWHPERFRIVALAAGTDSPRFRAQARALKPEVAGVAQPSTAPWDVEGVPLLHGEQGVAELAAWPSADRVVVACSGRWGLRPTLRALEAGKPVALANKEALVMAGHLVMAASARTGAPILPIDSEHNAVWQCLRGESHAADQVRTIWLTASGGAFRDWPLERLGEVTPEQALQHPTWKMGPKVTVDSATLMNKGNEVIEAAWLFGLPLERIKIVMHRESVVHALVEFVDGSLKAQLAVPDMRLPIQYALTYPERLPSEVPTLDPTRLGTLHFGEVDPRRFRCAFIAYEAARLGGTYPSVMAGANDAAVERFLAGDLRFDRIPEVIEQALDRHVPTSNPDLETVLEAHAWGRASVEAAPVRIMR